MSGTKTLDTTRLQADIDKLVSEKAALKTQVDQLTAENATLRANQTDNSAEQKQIDDMAAKLEQQEASDAAQSTSVTGDVPAAGTDASQANAAAGLTGTGS